ncbi:hypothetical protein TWF481_008402 [Arthrobotrys musiformis]|uniref:C2H2-type domain-containing protein n=1 Tax=Arthrobotrys musiformis TaxID=47236 RepID=A0AAV9W719_9PEZI
MVSAIPHYEHECLPCDWMFSSATDLRDHIIEDHVSIICQSCDDRAFSGIKAFKDHYPFRLHQFKCGKCGAGINGTDPHSLLKAIDHMKGCQSVFDRHCVKVYHDSKEYYEHCRTDRAHIRIADAWEREDNRRRYNERQERLAHQRRVQIESDRRWDAYQLYLAQDRLENENRDYIPFDPLPPLEEDKAPEPATSTDIQQPADEKTYNSQGNLLEAFGSDKESEEFDYSTDWTDHATPSEEEMMSLKERMSRQQRRVKRAIKREAKRVEEERRKVEKEEARKKAIEAARLEARMKLSPEELREAEEKERLIEQEKAENAELIRKWVLENAEARREYNRTRRQNYDRDD